MINQNDTSEVRIRRATKGQQNPYAMVLRAPFEDSRLSWEARGVLAYVLVKPDDWSTQAQDLINKGPAGRNKVYRIINELIEFGYFERIPIKNGNLNAGYEIVVYEQPFAREADFGDTEFRHTEFRHTDFGDTEFRYTENRDHNKEEHITNTNIEQKLNELTTNMNKDEGVHVDDVGVVVVSSSCSDVGIDDPDADPDIHQDIDRDVDSDIDKLLARYGVSNHMIVKYRSQYEESYLLQKIHYLEFSIKQRPIKNTAGWLSNAITRDYDEPHGYIPPISASGGQQSAFQPVSEPVSLSDEKLANGLDGQPLTPTPTHPLTHSPTHDLREETEQLLRAEQYGPVSHEQAMTWAGSVVCMERHVNALPKLLGVLGNCLTIGVSAFDMSFLSGRGAALIERQIQRFGGDYSYELVMV